MAERLEKNSGWLFLTKLNNEPVTVIGIVNATLTAQLTGTVTMAVTVTVTVTVTV